MPWSAWPKKTESCPQRRSAPLLVSTVNPAHPSSVSVFMMITNDAIKPVLIFLSQRNSRYDGQIAVFGTKLQDLLGKQRYFLVSWPTESSSDSSWRHVAKEDLEMFHVFGVNKSREMSKTSIQLARWLFK